MHEVYLKLPCLNYSNEVIFSSQVPELSIKRIIDKFRANGIDMEMQKINGRIVLFKTGNVKFDVYYLNSL